VRLSRRHAGRARRLRPQRCRSASASSPPERVEPDALAGANRGVGGHGRLRCYGCAPPFGSRYPPSPARTVVCVGMAVSVVTGARRRSGRRTQCSRRGSWCGWASSPPRSGVRAAIGVDAGGIAGAGRGVDGHGRLRWSGARAAVGVHGAPGAVRIDGRAGAGTKLRSGGHRCLPAWVRRSAVRVDVRTVAGADVGGGVHRLLQVRTAGQPFGSIAPPPSPVARTWVVVFIACSSSRRSRLPVRVDQAAFTGLDAAVDRHRPLLVSPSAVGIHGAAGARADACACAHRLLALVARQPSGSMQDPMPARVCVLVLIVSSLSWLAAQPLGSMPGPLPARVCVIVLTVSSLRGGGSAVRVHARPAAGSGVRAGSHRVLAMRVRSAVGVQPGAPAGVDVRMGGHRRLRSAVGVDAAADSGAELRAGVHRPLPRQPLPLGSIPQPMPARSRVDVCIRLLPRQPLSSILAPAPARTRVWMVMVVSPVSRCRRSWRRRRRGPASGCSSSSPPSAVAVDLGARSRADPRVGAHRFVSRAGVWMQRAPRASAEDRCSRLGPHSVRPRDTPGGARFVTGRRPRTLGRSGAGRAVAARCIHGDHGSPRGSMVDRPPARTAVVVRMAASFRRGG